MGEIVAVLHSSQMPRRAHPSRTSRATLGLLCGLVAAGALAGCGRRVDQGWIFDDAAVVRCTVSGRNHELDPAWLDVPVPLPPTNLFARAMDPVALDGLGFERDATICVALDAPSAEDVEAAQGSLRKLVDTRAELDLAIRRLPACACSEVRRAGLRSYFPSCDSRRARAAVCQPDEAVAGRVRELAVPLDEAVAAAVVPKRHWRMFGRADRPDRFAVRFSDIVGMYEGGSELFVPGQTPGGGRSDALVAALLDQPDVLAVVRQDAGMSVLVVRAMGRQLVFDLFMHDTSGERDLLGALASALDEASIDSHVAALARPGGGRRLLHDPRGGPVLAVDREALTRVDEAAIAMSALADRPYDPQRERRTSPPDLVDGFEFQLDPEGVLRGRAHLTEAGVSAVEEAGDTQLSIAFDQLPFDSEPPTFEPAAEADLVLRGQPLEHGLFDGIHGLFTVLQAVERSEPGALEGNLERFAITFPSGPLPGDLDTRPGLERLRERLSKQRHRLEVERDGDEFTFTLAPQ